MSVTAFADQKIIAQGELAQVALAVASHSQTVLVLDDQTGKPVDLDLRGGAAEITARYAPISPAPEKAGRGRPKLGVVPREVTLLPRHWDWLNEQPGGASAALRRLVDSARKENAGQNARRQAQDLAYRVLSVLAGDLPDYEEALRAFYADDEARFEDLTSDWPADIRSYVLARVRAVRTAEAETTEASGGLPRACWASKVSTASRRALSQATIWAPRRTKPRSRSPSVASLGRTKELTGLARGRWHFDLRPATAKLWVELAQALVSPAQTVATISLEGRMGGLRM